MTLKKYLSFLFIILLINCISVKIKAQNIIHGIVTDSITGEPLPFISVHLKGSTIGTMTDNSGKFSLSIPNSAKMLYASSIGYREKSVLIKSVANSTLKIELALTSYKISEVIIKPKKQKYIKKGNPAVNFVLKVIKSKDRYSPYNKAYYNYQHHEKIILALNNFQKEKHLTLLRKYSFLTEYVDTSRLSGKPILPLSTKEKVEDYYFQKSPRTEKRLVIAKKYSGIEEMLPEEGVDQILGEVFKDVDIYNNYITLFLRPFVSPISNGATNFYKYYLMDTVKVEGERCVDLAFVPFSSQSPGFTGHLYVTLDSTWFVKKVKLNFPKDINLNYIQNMSIEQNFQRAPDGTRLLMNDDIEVEFYVLSKSSGFYATRINSYTNHTFKIPENKAVFNEKENTILADNATNKPESFWSKFQKDSTIQNRKSVERMLETLRKDPFYYYSEKVFSALVTGYIVTNSKNNKLSIGPIYSTFSSNTVEGVRLRIGGYTTANLNDHLFAGGYLAYGIKDHKAKYHAELEYSFDTKKKQANEFPIHSIRALYSYDLNRLGQHYTTSEDNVLLSLKRFPDDKVTYQRKIEVIYNKEFYSQLSYGINARYRTEFATGYLPFIDNGTLSNIPSFSMGEAELRIRYAPGEKIYQTLSKRYSITRSAPVFSLSHIVAIKGVFGSNYTEHHTEISFQKRFWFSEFGNANVIVRAGKVWTKEPFPLLIIPNANLSYIIQYDTYSMLNATEFINDQYASWDLNYNLNGFLFNRIPFIQYLKLREILSFRGMYGSLRDQNNPVYSNGLYQFPASSYSMGKDPYMEAGIGIDNIFKVLRVDYVWRLTYLNHPNIDKSGIRIFLDFNF